MENKFRFVPVDSSLKIWLLEKLLQDPPKSPCAGEFLDGVRELVSGQQTSLLLGDGLDQRNQGMADTLTAGALTLYPRNRKVSLEGREVSLTPKEFDILYFLMQNRGEVFTKEQIYRAVWEEDYLMDDSNIMAFVRKLRKKIEPNPDAPQYILTIWGIGYKFNETI